MKDELTIERNSVGLELAQQFVRKSGRKGPWMFRGSPMLTGLAIGLDDAIRKGTL